MVNRDRLSGSHNSSATKLIPIIKIEDTHKPFSSRIYKLTKTEFSSNKYSY